MVAQMKHVLVRLVHCEQKICVPNYNFICSEKGSLRSDKWKSNGLWRDVQ